MPAGSIVFSEALQNAIDQQKPQQEIPLTDEEKAFLQEDLAANLAKAPLAWDEIESLGYVFFEDGYLDKFPPSEKSIYGNGLTEPELYALARRMQQRRRYTKGTGSRSAWHTARI